MRKNRSGGRRLRYVARLYRRRRWIAALALALALVSLYGVTQLHFSTDYRVFFDRDDPQRRELERVAENFGRDDNLLIIIEPRDGDMFTPARLRLLAEITEKAAALPHAARVDSLANFLTIDNSGLVPEAAPLVPETDGLTEEGARLIRGQALAEPLLAGRLVSRHTAAVGVNVVFDLPPGRAGETRRAVAAARRLVDDMRAEHPGLRVGLTGIAAINDAFAAASQRDLATLLPVMAAVIIAVMMLMLRSLRGTALALSGVTLSSLVAMGMAGALGLELTPSTAAVPAIILAVAVADAMHLLLGYVSARGAGLPRRPALARSLRVHAFPIFLTSLTTVIGFLALNSSDSPPLRHLGSLAALGVAFAWAWTMLALPALILLGPPDIGRHPGRTRAALGGLARFLIRRRRLVAFALIGGLIPLMAQTFSLRINETFYRNFSESMPVRADTQFVLDRLTGVCEILWMLDSGKAQGAHDPEFMAQADDFVRWLEAQPDVAHVAAATTLLRRLDAAVVPGTPPGGGELPKRADAIAAYLNIYADTAPEGRGLSQLVNPDRSALRVAAVLGDVDNARLRAIATEAGSRLRERMTTARPPVATGPCPMFGEVAYRNIRAMFLGTGLAFGLIALSLMAALASVRLGLVSLVPNVLPPFAAFGVWALLYDEVGLAASVITATSLGVIVDATVHILAHYRTARRAGASPEEAVTRSLGRCGAAVWAATVILIAGFAVLGLSSFRITHDLGLLTAIALSIGIAAAFLLLPPLLLLTDRLDGRKPPTNLHSRSPRRKPGSRAHG